MRERREEKSWPLQKRTLAATEKTTSHIHDSLSAANILSAL